MRALLPLREIGVNGERGDAPLLADAPRSGKLAASAETRDGAPGDLQALGDLRWRQDVSHLAALRCRALHAREPHDLIRPLSTSVGARSISAPQSQR
jgi:hypothetical protein